MLYSFKEGIVISNKELRLNEKIRVAEVRLLDEDGEMAGVVSIEDALKRAAEMEMDLVEIAPGAEPPVCRIMDFGKYKYQLQKKKADQRKKNHHTEVKQIRIKTFRIDPHDLGIKMKKARDFLEDGNRLLVTMMFRAREHNHSDMGRDLLLEQVAKPLDDIAKVDSPPRKDGRRMVMMMTPVVNVKKIVAKRKAKEEAEASRLKRQAEAEAAAMAAGEPMPDPESYAEPEVEDVTPEEE